MEFWDETANESLHVLALGLNQVEAHELATKLRAVRGVDSRTEHKVVFESGGRRIEIFVHPEQSMTV